MNHRLIAYVTASTQGVATVATDRTRPSWSECREQISGYITGRDLGPAPTYTLRYTKAGRVVVRANLTAEAVERVGGVVTRVADRMNDVENLAVLNASGADVTFDFACFR
jgi:hypothetical protein